MITLSNNYIKNKLSTQHITYEHITAYIYKYLLLIDVVMVFADVVIEDSLVLVIVDVNVGLV